MKLLVILTFGVLWQNVMLAQIADNTESTDSTNIYYQSMIKYCDYLTSINIDPKTLYLEENPFVTKSIPTKIGSFDIRILNIEQTRNRTKSNSIELIRIVPLRVKNEDFFVNIIPFRVTYAKKNFNYINSGGAQVIFEYDHEINKFQFKEIRHGTI